MAKTGAKPRVISDTEEPVGMPVVRMGAELDGILGQERAVELLRSAMAADRVHHAWIFGGPAGVGKFTAALAFAGMLLDPTVERDLSGRLSADPESQVQRLMREGAHPDLRIITKELAAFSRDDSVRNSKQRVIPIEVIREFLLEPASRTRVMQGESRAGKVFIVDEAELLRPNAQDTLLKTLEEPPAGTVIILVSASEERLSPTIRSRCQRVGFLPLDDKTLGKWIDAHLKADGKPLEARKKQWLTRYAGGSPGWAKAAVENDLFAWHEALEPLLEEVAAGRFPVQMGGVMAKLVDERAAAWVKENPEASKEAANVLWARRLLAFIAEHERQGLREKVGKAGAEGSLRAIDLVGEAERQIGMNVNATQVMENLAVQMAAAMES